MVGILPALERDLARLFGREHCIVVGSGTAAAYCVFQMLREEYAPADERAILFPNITCETAVNAAIFAGFVPRFCDVRREDYVLCTDSARRELESRDIVGVVPTHIFGHLVDVQALERVTGRTVLVIEDAAQAYGGALGKRPAGGMGDVSVLSFGHGKLLDCGGGGALLCDDSGIATRCREIAATLINDSGSAASHRNQVMKRMLATRKQLRGDRGGLIRSQRTILREHRDGYLAPCRSEWAESIRRALPGLEAIVRSRKDLMSRLDEALKDSESVTLPHRQGAPALWRYSFRIDGPERDAKVRALKREGLAVSRLFSPCAHKFSEEPESLPESERVSESILNLSMPHSPPENDAVIGAVKKVIV